MILVNALVFASVLSIIFILRCYYKSLCKEQVKKECDFKFSRVKYKNVEEKRFASFTISLKDKNQFFIDFPLMFRFYGDTRFKAKVKIKYETLRSGAKPEKIVDKVIEFETKTIECQRRITDIIVGEIEIEIEMLPYYGNPIIEFEILSNNLCILKKPFRKIIKFS
jgi:hypothetical protein